METRQRQYKAHVCVLRVCVCLCVCVHVRVRCHDSMALTLNKHFSSMFIDGCT